MASINRVYLVVSSEFYESVAMHLLKTPLSDIESEKDLGHFTYKSAHRKIISRVSLKQCYIILSKWESEQSDESVPHFGVFLIQHSHTL